jgi:hypothetical protein
LRILIYGVLTTSLVGVIATGCDDGSHIYTEPHSRACLTGLTSHRGSYQKEFNADATNGSVRLAFQRGSRTSDLQVDVNFMSNEKAAKKTLKPKSTGWHHPNPNFGVEFDRRGNVIEFWHQGVANGPAPTSDQRKAVDRCLS